METKDILELLLKDDRISMEDVESIMKRKEKEKYISSVHKYEIYKGTDGRFRTYILDESKKTKRRLIAKTRLEDLYNELYKIYSGGETRETIEDIYPEWLDFKALHTNAETYIRRIHNDWERFYEGSDIIKIPVKNLDKLTVERWIFSTIKRFNLTQKAYYNCSMIFRQILDYAIDKGLIDTNVFSRIKIDSRIFASTTKSDSRKQVFMDDEEKAIKEFAWECFNKGSHHKQPLVPLAILFQFQTGLRIGELRALTHEDILNDCVRISKMIRNETGEIVDHPKGKYGERLIPLTDEAKYILELVDEIKKDREVHNSFLFSLNDKPIGCSAINKAYYSYCDHLGFARKSSHKVRKTVISSLIDSGMNIDTIRRLAGHTDERTTYNCYCYDRRSDEANLALMNSALR